MRDEFWTQKDGTRIKVSEMSEQHVRNALCMVLRNRIHEELEAQDYEWDGPSWYAFDD